MTEYDPNTIISNANECYIQKNNLEEAQMCYQSALLDWVDDAREMENNGQEDITKMKDAIVTLWIEYAKLNSKASMFKAATEAYEQATNCPIAGNMGKLWSSYAKYQQSRNRFKSAQKVYLRALVGDKDIGHGMVTNVEEQNQLWSEFLEMMKVTNEDDTLTLDQLREAVDSEYSVKAKQKRIEAEMNNNVSSTATTTTTTTTNNNNHAIEPDAKRARIEQQYEIPKEAVEIIASSLIETTKAIAPELNAEWLARDGTAYPTRPEPPLFTPSPPKLGDASGKDLLGTELALQLIRILLNKASDGKSQVCNNSGSIVLDIVNGCWMMTALKEKEAATSQEALDKKLLADVEKKEKELDDRLAVAGSAITAVQQMNDNEKAHFMSMCNQQRQQLSSLIAWEFRHLLAIQQEILTKAGLPYFNGPTVDNTSIRIQANICTFLHSAFYLRNRVGEKSHVAMLTSQETKLSSQTPIPMPLPKPEIGTTYPMPLPPPVPLPVPLPPPPPPPSQLYAAQQQQMAQPTYAAQQPGQYAPPPPIQYIGGATAYQTVPPQQPNQYQYR